MKLKSAVAVKGDVDSTSTDSVLLNCDPSLSTAATCLVSSAGRV